MSHRLVSLSGNAAATQTGLLIVMQGCSILLAFALTMLITRTLDVAAYGLFRYAMTFLALAMTLLQFGWPYSASRLLALESDRATQKEIVGACVLMVGISTLIGVLGTTTLFLVAERLGFSPPRVLLWVAPFIYVTLGQYMITSVCQG